MVVLDNHKLHYCLFSQTGQGKSVAGESFFHDTPHQAIYFNSQLNVMKVPSNTVVVKTADAAFNAYLDGVSKIILNPVVKATSVKAILQAKLKILESLIDKIILFKYAVISQDLADSTPPLTLFVDEIHWYMDQHKIPEHLEWIAKSGRRFLFFLFGIAQRLQDMNNHFRQESHYIVGNLKTKDYLFAKKEIPELLKVGFETYDFYLYNNTTNAIELIRVTL